MRGGGLGRGRGGLGGPIRGWGGGVARFHKIIKKRGECRCMGLDLTQNHLKMEKKTKKEEKKREKKIVFGAGFEPTTLRLQILHLTR